VTHVDMASLYGLTVESELPLYQNTECRDSSVVDVRIRLAEPMVATDEVPAGTALAYVRSPEQAHYVFVRLDDGSYLLRFFRAADFAIEADLREVSVRLVHGVDSGVASVLATGTLLAFILMMRGEPVLHASAVQVGDHALAFVGHSGMGKSTMATLMCAEGASLVTDDVLRLDLIPAASGAAPACYLGPTEIRLRNAAVELAHRFACPHRRLTGDARHALRAVGATEDRLPLGAIVVPRPRRDMDEIAVVRLPAKEAMLYLLRFPRIVGWQANAIIGAEFGHAATIAGVVPVYVADVPWGPPFLTDLGSALITAVGLADQRLAGSR
jgi:hypothetical protein